MQVSCFELSRSWAGTASVSFKRAFFGLVELQIGCMSFVLLRHLYAVTRISRFR